MHPHPGFPTFDRLDDVCGSCGGETFDQVDAQLAARKEEVRQREAQRYATLRSDCRRAAAVAAAVALIAAAALSWRRGG